MMTVDDYLASAEPYDTAMADAMRAACGAPPKVRRVPFDVISGDAYDDYVSRVHVMYEDISKGGRDALQA